MDERRKRLESLLAVCTDPERRKWLEQLLTALPPSHPSPSLER